MSHKLIFFIIAIVFHICIDAKSAEVISVHIALNDTKIVKGKVQYRVPRDNSIDVVIHNKSDAPVSIWTTDNSWGYESISFKVHLDNGVEFIIKPKPQIFTVNFPGFRAIEAGEYATFRVVLDDKWENADKIEQAVSIACYYEVIKTKKSDELNVYIGKVHSRDYTFLTKK
jgi:hypothetical protein